MNCLRSVLVSLALLASAVIAEAQQPKVYRIGMLVTGSVATHGSRIEAFRQGLRELGYVEGKNIVIEYRYAEGKSERFANLAAEMVSLKPDVIYVGSNGFARAAKKATSTIPIISTGGDLVGGGIVSSLSHPGGNITGSTTVSPDLAGKKLELLKDVVPRVSRVAVLYNPSGSDLEEFKQTEIAARPLGVTIYPAQVRVREEFTGAFASMKKEKANALVLVQGTLINSHIKQVANFAMQYRLPSIGEAPDYANNGCMMSYGANLDDLWRRGAIFVDKILKGRKPAELPVEQPMKFDFVINLKTAKQIGLEIPQWTLMKADRVIK